MRYLFPQLIRCLSSVHWDPVHSAPCRNVHLLHKVGMAGIYLDGAYVWPAYTLSRYSSTCLEQIGFIVLPSPNSEKSPLPPWYIWELHIILFKSLHSNMMHRCQVRKALKPGLPIKHDKTLSCPDFYVYSQVLLNHPNLTQWTQRPTGTPPGVIWVAASVRPISIHLHFPPEQYHLPYMCRTRRALTGIPPPESSVSARG